MKHAKLIFFSVHLILLIFALIHFSESDLIIKLGPKEKAEIENNVVPRTVRNYSHDLNEKFFDPTHE